MKTSLNNVIFVILWAALAALMMNRLASSVDMLGFYPLAFIPLLVSRQNPSNVLKFGYMTCGLVALTVGLVFKMQVVIWIGAICTLFFMLGNLGFRASLLCFALIAVSPPFQMKFDLLFGFHLRQFATLFSVALLKLFDPSISQVGNAILVGEHAFHVEKICEGLKLASSLTVLLIIIFKRFTVSNNRYKSYFGWLGFVILGCMLWFTSNVIRIFLLVRLNIAPEDPLHELLGLAIFACFTVFPLVSIAVLGFRKTPNSGRLATQPLKVPVRYSFIPACLIGVIAATNAIQLAPKDSTNWPNQIASFTKSEDRKEFTKIPDISVYDGNSSFLILKNNLNPIRVAHHPLQCWRAIGYNIKSEVSELSSMGQIRRHIITRGDRRFQLVWFYLSHGSKNVISTDSEWRWRKDKVIDRKDIILVNWFAPIGTKEPDWRDLSQSISSQLKAHNTLTVLHSKHLDINE